MVYQLVMYIAGHPVHVLLTIYIGRYIKLAHMYTNRECSAPY